MGEQEDDVLLFPRFLDAQRKHDAFPLVEKVEIIERWRTRVKQVGVHGLREDQGWGSEEGGKGSKEGTVLFRPLTEGHGENGGEKHTDKGLECRRARGGVVRGASSSSTLDQKRMKLVVLAGGDKGVQTEPDHVVVKPIGRRRRCPLGCHVPGKMEERVCQDAEGVDTESGGFLGLDKKKGRRKHPIRGRIVVLVIQLPHNSQSLVEERAVPETRWDRRVQVIVCSVPGRHGKNPHPVLDSRRIPIRC